MSFQRAPPALVIARIAELAEEDPTNRGATMLSRTNRECAWAARPAMMKNTTVYVGKASSPLAEVTTWMAANTAYRALVRHLTISERGLTSEPRLYEDSDVTPTEILTLVNTFEDLRELTLNGLNITELGPLSLPAPMGPPSSTSLTITGSHADVTMHAVASIATRLPRLTTLQVDGYGGEVMDTDLDVLKATMEGSVLPLTALRVRRCTIDQVEAVNLILRASAPTLAHLSIELWATPDPHYEIIGPARVDLTTLTRLGELDIFIPLRVDYAWYDIVAHSLPVLHMVEYSPPTITTTHVVFWNRMDTVDEFLRALATFPIQSLCALLRRVPSMRKVYIRAGGSDVSTTMRASRWQRVKRISRGWRTALRKYERFLELI
ncbi:hypothetical protein PsYK624_118790 [Phanerochaete sordida]|uniref:Uncharacterized protein n=1 Tax=Phanerochaete sordida TaxID=48140 RepID=A0A9P3GIS4_9APHY|nr:hypothetical protein PsYK624_118790 [Phanerochaete sordida]